MDWYIGTEWNIEHKGLRKKVLALDFVKLEKPHLVSKIQIKVENVKNLNGRNSKYLSTDQIGEIQLLEMGSALTPVDCYVELLIQQMIVGERSQCNIKTRKDAAEITFQMTLLKIVETKEIFKLTVKEMYELALRYKENGVAMFKEYPLFAHSYFARAAKCLISYKPFEHLTMTRDGVEGSDMETLFIQVQTNLAACLLNEKRYEDVIYQTKFVETQLKPSEKSIYRRAMAQLNIKEYEAALKTIEKVPNFQEKKEFAKLHQSITENQKSSNDNYKNVMQRMFSS